MNKNRTIMPATAADEEEILALYDSLKGTPFCAWENGYPGRQEIAFDLGRDSLFVMREEGTIIAAISIDADEEVMGLPCWTDSLAPGGELSRLAVALSCQNQGIAREMLLYGMQVLRERGFQSIHFLVNKHNEKAIRSYSHLNFTCVGDTFLFEQPFWCYEKAL